MARVRIEQMVWMNGIGFGLIAAEQRLAQILGLILFVVTLVCLWILVSRKEG